MRPAVGQLFRGGVDYNSYLRQIVLFRLFKRRPLDLSVVKGVIKTRDLLVCSEPANLESVDWEFVKGRGKCFVFSGYEKYFAPLNGHHQFIVEQLRGITRKKYLDIADGIGNVPIGICVRCGNDFAMPPSDRKKLLPGEKTPLGWFVNTLKAVREAAGFSADAFVVSDGTEEQLSELLSLGKMHFVRPGSAISDLLVLSRAKVLLASGSSSFAAWGAFLGQMPSASHPGQPLTDWQIEPSRRQFLGEFDPEQPNPVFLAQAAHALTSMPVSDDSLWLGGKGIAVNG